MGLKDQWNETSNCFGLRLYDDGHAWLESHLLNLLAEKSCCQTEAKRSMASCCAGGRGGDGSDKCPAWVKPPPWQGGGQRKVNYHRSQSILSLITLDGTGKANGQAGWRHRFITGSWLPHPAGVLGSAATTREGPQI